MSKKRSIIFKSGLNYNNKQILAKFALIFLSLILLCTKIYAQEKPAPEITNTKSKENKAKRKVDVDIETSICSSAISKYPADASEVTSKHIEETGSQNAGAALEGISGVTVLGVDSGKGKSTIALRGFRINYIQVLLDGIPINTPNDRTIDFSIIPAEIIDRIEVIKGPNPVSFGMVSPGGVINVITKKGINNKGAFLRAMSGSFGTIKGAAFGGINSGIFDAFALILSNNSNGYTKHISVYSTDRFIKSNFEIKKDLNLYAIYWLETSQRQAPNPINPDGSIRYFNSGYWAGSRDWEFPEIYSSIFHAGLKRDCETGLNFQVDLYDNVYNDTLRGFVPAGTITQPPQQSWAAYYRPDAWNYSYWQSSHKGIYAKIYQNFTKSYRAETGYFYEDLNFRNDRQGRENPAAAPGSMSKPTSDWQGVSYWYPPTNVNYKGIYFQNDIDFSNEWSMNLGIRKDYSTINSPLVSSYGSLSYTKNADLFRLCVGNGGRLATLRELQGKFGNPNLKSEKSFSVDLGYHRIVENKYEVDASVFRSYIKNTISSIDPNVRGSMLVNKDKLIIQGVEAAYTYYFNKDFTACINATLLNRKYNETLPSNFLGIPDFSNSITIANNPKGKIGWTIEGIYAGRRLTDDKIIPALPPYYLVNLRVGYTNKTKNGEQTYEIIGRNILNKKYQDTLYYPMPGAGIWGQITSKI